MAQTIESFVEKLQAEGVEAGKAAADKLLADARQQADKVLADAKAEADRTLADAKAQADATFERSKAELDLAARDVLLRLRQALSRAVQAVLAAGVRESLSDAEFLGKTLHQLVVMYAAADCEGRGRIQINVPADMRQKLVDWALTELGPEAIDHPHVGIDLNGTLKSAGFEYEVSGATVEVTLDSVVQAMMELVSPALREIVERAAEASEDS
jgi:F0F1-type ATP synthase membrane subunit b/b'